MAHKVFTQELGFGELLSESINIVKDKFKILTIFSLVFQLPAVLYTVFNPVSEYSAAMNPGVVMKILILGLISIISSIGLLKIVEDSIFQDKQTFGDYFAFSLKRYFPYFITLIVFIFVIGSGFILLIIPGVIAITYFAFTVNAVTLRNISNPFDAFKYSYNLVKGNGMRVFGYGFGAFVLTAIVSLLLYTIPFGFNPTAMFDPSTEINPVLNLIPTIFGIFPSMFFTAFLVLLMINLEVEKGYYIDENEEENIEE